MSFLWLSTAVNTHWAYYKAQPTMCGIFVAVLFNIKILYTSYSNMWNVQFSKHTTTMKMTPLLFFYVLKPRQRYKISSADWTKMRPKIAV